MEFKVLTQFRDEQSPELGNVNGIPMSTLTKDELLDYASSTLKINLLEIARIGNIDPVRENVCQLLHFATKEQECPEDEGGSPSKKRKTNDRDAVKSLEKKVEHLSRQLEDKKRDDQLSEFERLKRETKEEAAKREVNVEILHEKLILLESMSSKLKDENKDKISMVLSRFHAHKSTPSFAATLVLKLLSTKEEEIILDKEQKLMKQFGLHYTQVPPVMMNAHEGIRQPGFFSPYGNQGFRMSYQQRFRPQFPPRQPGVCFKCRRPGHMIKDCPQ